MNDMTSVIVPKSDQINADDLIGGTMTITINEVRIKGGQEQPVSIYFAGSDKAFRPCKSMSRVLVAAWGPDAKKYVGRSLTLYRDPKVKWAGMEVGGIRISHMSDLERPMTMVLTMTKGSRAPYVVKPLEVPAKRKDGEFTLADARRWIADAVDLSELEHAWKQRNMAQFRDQLRSELEARKAELSINPNDGFGEGAPSDKLAEALDHMSRAGSRMHIDGLLKEWAPDLADEEFQALKDAAARRYSEIGV